MNAAQQARKKKSILGPSRKTCL